MEEEKVYKRKEWMIEDVCLKVWIKIHLNYSTNKYPNNTSL